MRAGHMHLLPISAFPRRLKRNWECTMPGRNTLRFGPLGASCAHVCADMQRLFAEDTEWKRPCMRRVLPVVRGLVSAYPERTFFTRFIPARHPEERRGTWRRYYERWSSVTMEKLGPEMVGLLPQLAAFVPPAAVIDKQVYSPWHWPALDIRLRERDVDTIIVSGVRALSTVLGAVDRGYRVVVATDALCSSSSESHDALLALFRDRYSEQVEAVTSDVIIENWC
jgi:nicotinamidase-related amidase